MTEELPPALRPWSASLSFLTPEAAVHLGPLVRQLDALLGTRDAAQDEHGEPDGYGGVATRGTVDRLLLSEWLLADELPMEFLRRAAAREQLHVEPEFRAERRGGSVAVLFDVGPDQLGAARLVQLAALVVLHRRALSAGTDLVIGLTGEPADRWHDGALPEHFVAWRNARSARTASPEELAARAATVEEPDRLWILAGDEVAAAYDGPGRLIRTRESSWDADGTTAVEVVVGGHRAVLAVPSGPQAVVTIRGAAARRRSWAPAPLPASGPMHHPTFPSADRRLLLRGETSSDLVTLQIPDDPAGGESRPRRHHLPGPIVAASALNRRLVVLVLLDDRMVVRTIGRRLSRVEDLEVPAAGPGLDPDSLGGGPIPPLFYDSGDLLCRIGEAWWRLSRNAPPEHESSIVAVGPGTQMDHPSRAWLHDGRLGGRFGQYAAGVDPHELVIVHGGPHVAWTAGTGAWRVHGPGQEVAVVEVPDDEDVLGIAAPPGSPPALVTRSGAGLVVRLRTPDGLRTLTACSGPAIAHAVHPGLPLLAVQRSEDLVEVLRIPDGVRMAAVRVT